MFNYVFHLPDGSTFIPNYGMRQMLYRVGEVIILEGEKKTWVIDDIQHQFKEEWQYVLSNVILVEDAL